MIRIQIVLLCAFFLTSGSLSAQEIPKVSEETPSEQIPEVPTVPAKILDPEMLKLEDSLIVLATRILSDTSLDSRTSACERFIPLFEEALIKDSEFEHPFDSLLQISILEPEDGVFRLCTWQLFKSDEEYFYYGLLQLKDDPTKIIKLKDKSDQILEDLEWEILDAENWYGALYYNVKSFKSKRKKHYLLFGFDGFSFFGKRKIIDVLSFVEGKPVFGKSVFVKMDGGREVDSQNRIVLDYFADTAIRCNYDEALKMIIVDHLIPVRNPYKPSTDSYVPDGSYEGYKLKKGKWVFVDKIYHQTQEEPPRPMPVLDTRKGKDINGN